jgi:hypothetical protein
MSPTAIPALKVAQRYQKPSLRCSRPDTGIRIACLIHLPSPGSRYELSQVFKPGAAWSSLESNYLEGDCVLEYPGGVSQSSRGES